MSKEGWTEEDEKQLRDIESQLEELAIHEFRWLMLATKGAVDLETLLRTVIHNVYNKGGKPNCLKDEPLK